jgi:hypothetical protein
MGDHPDAVRVRTPDERDVVRDLRLAVQPAGAIDRLAFIQARLAYAIKRHGGPPAGLTRWTARPLPSLAG